VGNVMNVVNVRMKTKKYKSRLLRQLGFILYIL
jgi:hypothetical protein